MEISQLYVICVLIVLQFRNVLSRTLTEPESDDQDTDTWLADESNYYFDYMGDAPASLVVDETDRCPAFPEKVPTYMCNKKKCLTDSNCKKGNICCYNGCIRSCVKPIDPPVYIDWIREPRRRLRSGISWLLSGPDSVKDLEPCSTTPYDKEEDPLLCPHGYICHVEKPGDPERDIPNRGHCIRETDDQLIKLGLNGLSSNMKAGSCLMDKYMLLDGAHMSYRGRKCFCKNGFLTCFDRS